MEAALFLFYRNNYRESCPAGERSQAHNTSFKGMLCHEKPGPEMHVFPPLLHLVTYRLLHNNSSNQDLHLP